MMRWYAVHTRPASEAKAAEHLRRQGYEAYLPRHRRWVRHSRKRELVRRPLFPCYLFVGIDRERMAWRPVLSTIGVEDMVRGGDEPVAIPNTVIETLRARERDGAFDEPAPVSRLKPGERVRLGSGPFADVIGRLAAAGEGEHVAILFEFLGRTIEAKVPAVLVEAA